MTDEIPDECYRCGEVLNTPIVKAKEDNDGRYRTRYIHEDCEYDYRESVENGYHMRVESTETITPPSFEELDKEDCEIELQGPDMYVRYDGWEYYLGECNGPCHPSLDLDSPYTEVRFYPREKSHRDGYVVVFHEIPEDDVDWEIKFSLRNVFPEGVGE